MSRSEASAGLLRDDRGPSENVSDLASSRVPSCPITGEPAVRLVQWVKARFLRDLWWRTFKTNARTSFGETQRFGLWESPTGLYFFDPMLEGDHAFYTQFYARLLKLGFWSKDYVRREFELAAKWIKPGDRVLDVGCGFASFRRVIPQASYVGLDPNFADGSPVEGVRRETLQQHLTSHAGSYDAVCSFEVVEHLRDPATMFADMVRATRPGGLILIGVPHVPSALTRIPNFVLNAPPHHLTWWTRTALTALAERSGAKVVGIENVPWGTDDAQMYWMERCSLIRCKDIHYLNHLGWHIAALLGFACAWVMQRVRGTPKTTDEGVALLLVARRDP